MNKCNIITGIDAMDYLMSIPESIWKQIDTVIFDPPYYNESDLEKVNQRSKLKDDKVNWDKQYTRIMNSDHRNKILQFIKSKKSDKARIVYFHTVKDRVKIQNLACEHIWVKPIGITLAGNNDRNNGEHILIEGERVKGKIKGRVLNKYINAKFDGFIPRACAKPTKIFSELYRHLDSKFILDPFAGYGNSIKSAVEMNLNIFACDIDSSLENRWRVYREQESLEGWV